MNCIASSNITPRRPALLSCLLLCAACNAQIAEPHAPADPLGYRIEYLLEPDPGSGTVSVTMRLTQPRRLLRELRFDPGSRLRDFLADGELVVGEHSVTWLPPAGGGELTWHADVAHRRNGAGYDALLVTDWGLFRAEDVIPRATTRTLKGAYSDTSLTFRLPPRWSVVTQYYDDRGRFHIDNAERRFDQPSGWIVVGRLGVRRDTIAGTRVAIAGPSGHSVRRLDTLALLHWTLPELARILPELPARLTVVSAGDPMWRGGLSAPQSLFLHADRPLISENATSTLLHEVMHIALGLRAAQGYDWIVEGLAEYYSLELLRRSGSISANRHADALREIRSWSTSAEALCAPVSSGATTALAVTVFDALDRELRNAPDVQASLDEVAARLWKRGGRVDLRALAAAAEQVAGLTPDSLHVDKLAGCHDN